MSDRAEARIDRMVELVQAGDLASFVREAHDYEPADLADVLAAGILERRLGGLGLGGKRCKTSRH